jgi:hypothetical protein
MQEVRTGRIAAAGQEGAGRARKAGWQVIGSRVGGRQGTGKAVEAVAQGRTVQGLSCHIRLRSPLPH